MVSAHRLLVRVCSVYHLWGLVDELDFDVGVCHCLSLSFVRLLHNTSK